MGKTGLQLQALSLYRACLRAARTKPPESRPGLLQFARAEFDRNRGINRLDFMRVEFLLRKGQKLLATLAAREAQGVTMR
ncbi:Succinate dehydrogenase assembly factor 1, mitochondrial [Tetrabaena socialis]|uniref:Succinate dehydrogenase assembly factor 1, mitochondrial n=1 Tax=Tetrabaena socialis TaxID=47790 RepID=A0A2J7ZWZ0_9CHLO|nr:Succinate dehydrogenase assembly factor 1, mitochondrial [Tetrabaena socialis]|eukprot:PNH04797.1 Succinate dehydrogenase assembly factor 1, mitochondrial [Tetrabaena socialis]